MHAILRGLERKPPRKFSPALVRSVYSECTGPADLDNLVASSYFEAVAWRFFHADVTNNHLELLQQMATYEYEALHTSRCLDLMVGDDKRLRQLLQRLLQATRVARVTTPRLEAATFLFLRVLVAHSPHAVCSDPNFESWKQCVLGPYAQSLVHTAPAADAAGVTRCFLHFLLGCVATRSPLSSHIRGSRIHIHFVDSPDPATRRLARLIHLALGDHADFVRFQVACKKSPLWAKLPSLAVSSKLDVPDTFADELANLSSDNLQEVLSRLQIDTSAISPESLKDLSFAPALIRCSVLGVGSYESLCDPHKFDESDIFDLFDHTCSTFFCPAPAFPAFVPHSPDFFHMLKCAHATATLGKINTHANTVLSRLSIVDPAADDGIKGSSKYFSQLSSVHVKGSKADLTAKKMEVRPGDLVLLLELQKPNRHGGSPRTVKHGVLAAELARVVSVSDTITVRWNLDGFEDRYNAVICVPTSLSFSEPILRAAAPKVLTPGQGGKPCTSFSVNYIGDDSGPDRKKTRLEHGTTTRTINHNGCTVHVKQETAVPSPMSAALYSMVSEPVSVVEVAGCNEARLTNMFLETLHMNWPEQSCLVVVPSREAAALFESAGAAHLTFKWDSHGFGVALQLQHLQAELAKVQRLAARLGLHDYDFHSDVSKALMLHESHVEPRWRAYLKSLTKTEYHQYPFADIAEASLKEQLLAVTDHFAAVRGTFAALQRYLPLCKVQVAQPQHSSEVRDFLVRHMPYVVVAAEDLRCVDRPFDNVVTADLRWLPGKDTYRRLVVYGTTPAPLGARHVIATASSRDEIAAAVGVPGAAQRETHNAGFAAVCQHIPVANAKTPAIVEEARYCVELYRYMRALGYPWHKISIVYKTPAMKMLVEEIAGEQGSGEDEVGPIVQNVAHACASDYMIVTSEGEPLVREVRNLARICRLGLYIVGSESPPMHVRSGQLQVHPGEKFGHQIDGAKRGKPKTVASADELADLVQKLQRNPRSE